MKNTDAVKPSRIVVKHISSEALIKRVILLFARTRFDPKEVAQSKENE